MFVLSIGPRDKQFPGATGSPERLPTCKPAAACDERTRTAIPSCAYSPTFPSPKLKSQESGSPTSCNPIGYDSGHRRAHLGLRARLAFTGNPQEPHTPGSDFTIFCEGNHRDLAQERLWNHSSSFSRPGQPADDKLDVEVARLEIEITPR
jgi:hypothetical protein